MARRKEYVLSVSRKKELIAILTEELPVLRAQAGVTQSELSKMVGISRQTYYSIELRNRPMSWNTFLALILYFDCKNSTRKLIRESAAYPRELFLAINGGERPNENESSIVGVPNYITDQLDAQALHSIRTVVMMEYARCSNMTGEDVIKAFDGVMIRNTVSREDSKAKEALLSIREETEQE